jgi:hypothetical protein
MSVCISHSPSVIDPEILTFAPTKPPQRVQKRSEARSCFWIVWTQVQKHADPARLTGCLAAQQ